MTIKFTNSYRAFGWVHSKALWSFDPDRTAMRYQGMVGFISEDRIHYVQKSNVTLKLGKLTEIGDNVTGYVNYSPYLAHQFLACVDWHEVCPFDLEKDIWDVRVE